MKTDQLLELYQRSLNALAPDKLVSQWLDANYSPDQSKLYAFAVGKAAVPMMQGLSQKVGNQLKKGLVITTEKSSLFPPNIFVLQGSHPLPDEQSLRAGETLLSFVESIPESSRVLALISGGTSALVEKPAGDLAIEEVREVFELLIESGADIDEVNSVRKHLSAIKGGKLLRRFNAVKLTNLVISDVPDDTLSTIGSGPTVFDNTTFTDAIKVLKNRNLWMSISQAVRKHLEQGRQGHETETVKHGSEVLVQTDSKIIGSAQKLAQTVAQQISDVGIKTHISKKAYRGDVSVVAHQIAEKVKKITKVAEPTALIFYGESTVSVTGDGKGGRNQELALHAAKEIESLKQIKWFSLATDGVDGPTDAAGAVVDGSILRKAREKGLPDVDTFLHQNNSYDFHRKMGSLIKTGPTLHNLMDLQIVFVNVD